MLMSLLHTPFRVTNDLHFRDSRTYYNLLCWLTGSLIKLVYFCRYDDSCRDDDELRSQNESLGSKSDNSRPVLRGKLHFAKFETSKINDCLEFIHTMKLHLGGTFTFACCNNHSLEFSFNIIKIWLFLGCILAVCFLNSKSQYDCQRQ